jgi:hypothetical protein
MDDQKKKDQNVKSKKSAIDFDSEHFIFKGLSLETFEDFELKLLLLLGTYL